MSTTTNRIDTINSSTSKLSSLKLDFEFSRTIGEERKLAKKRAL